MDHEITLRRIKGKHHDALRSYLRCRKGAQREAARKMSYWPRGKRTGKNKRELEEMRNRAVEAQMEAMKAIVGDLPSDLARGMDEASRQAQADKKGKRIVEG